MLVLSEMKFQVVEEARRLAVEALLNAPDLKLLAAISVPNSSTARYRSAIIGMFDERE